MLDGQLAKGHSATERDPNFVLRKERDQGEVARDPLAVKEEESKELNEYEFKKLFISSNKSTLELSITPFHLSRLT